MKIKILELNDDFVDENGDIMPENAIIDFSKHTILLTKNYNQNDALGTAKVIRVCNDIFIEEINFIDSTIEKAIQETYPCIGGRVVERDGRVIKSFTIDQVSFEISKNVDFKIKKVKEQSYV